MVVRIYTAYGGKTPVPVDVRICTIPELGSELMAIFLMYDRTPMYILFKKGQKNSECVVIVARPERRRSTESASGNE